MNHKKHLCLLLALLTISGTAMAACAENTDGGAQMDQGDASTMANEAEMDSLEQRKLVQDNVETIDYEGEVYSVITEAGKEDHTHLNADDMDERGDVLEEAIYERNAKVAERFNITIEVLPESSFEATKRKITQTVTAGDDAYDLIYHHVISAGGLATGDYLYNWHDVPTINFERPWWNNSNEDILTHNGICKLAVGEFALSALSMTYCMYFNKTLAANYNYENLYDIVNSGAWTRERLTQMTKDTFGDLNGNSTKDKDDLFGFAQTNTSSVATYLWAFDNPIFAKNNEGALEYVYKTEKVGEIVNWLDDYLFKQPGVYCDRTSTDWAAAFRMFEKNQVIITPGTFSVAIQWRDLEENFGIIPYPKWDDNQDTYYTMSDGDHGVLGVPYSAKDVDFIGAITEVLCAETWKSVHPAYYDVALKVKGARDEESIAILDMIFENRVFDFGFVYDNWNGVAFLLQSMLAQNNNNFESYYKKVERPVTKWYNKVLDAFE